MECLYIEDLQLIDAEFVIVMTIGWYSFLAHYVVFNTYKIEYSKLDLGFSVRRYLPILPIAVTVISYFTSGGEVAVFNMEMSMFVLSIGYFTFIGSEMFDAYLGYIRENRTEE